MSWLDKLKRKTKIAKLTLELKQTQLLIWWKTKRLQYLQWVERRTEKRRDYLESLRFQRGDDDE